MSGLKGTNVSDEYEALREALDNFGPKRTTMLLTRDGADAIRRLLSERDALAVDAMRYQWLRDNYAMLMCNGGRCGYSVTFQESLASKSFTPAMLDTAIDAASTPAAGE